VSHDAFVDVDTVRYSVPHRLARETVEVLVDESRVRIFRGLEVVADHRRSMEPHSRVIDPAHYDGLWRRHPTSPPTGDSPLHAMGRSLEQYAEVVGGAR
jgi:hypothetical protein